MFEALFGIVIAGFILAVLGMLIVWPRRQRAAGDGTATTGLPQKISRHILIISIILSVGFPVGFMAPYTRVGYWLFGADPVPVSDGVFFYAVSGMFAFIPYWLVAWHAKRSITKDEFNIYYIRGIIAGLSPVTLAFWLFVGAAAAFPPDGFLMGGLMFIAICVGLASGSFGGLIGFGYGVLERQRHERN